MVSTKKIYSSTDYYYYIDDVNFLMTFLHLIPSKLAINSFENVINFS